ncbi:MAG: CPBP family intramembrane metalloprotease [Clostridiales bacterium]|nr:CPBP family intramembrane metalloprotease [Clostridiales bacterium]
MTREYIQDIKEVVNLRHKIISLIAAISGIFISVYVITIFNRYLLMEFPLGLRMVLMIMVQWLMILAPIIHIKVKGEKVRDYLFIKKNLTQQIKVGIYLGLAMSVVFTIIPILMGLKDMVGSTSYTKPWQFAYEFVYVILGVALAEEFVFRGYIFNKLLEIKNSRWFAIILSSILFGLFHIFNGSLIQVFMTGFIGLVFCIFREKIKDCSLLSLVICHGLYDGLITLLVAYL